MPSHIDNTRVMLQRIRSELGVLRVSWHGEHAMASFLATAEDFVTSALRQLKEELKNE